MPRVRELRPLPIMREWHDANVVRLERPALADTRTKRVRVPKVRTPATPEDLRAIAAICPSRVTYCPGIPTKRFARQVQGSTDQSLIAIAEKRKQAKERL